MISKSHNEFLSRLWNIAFNRQKDRNGLKNQHMFLSFLIKEMPLFLDIKSNFFVAAMLHQTGKDIFVIVTVIVIRCNVVLSPFLICIASFYCSCNTPLGLMAINFIREKWRCGKHIFSIVIWYCYDVFVALKWCIEMPELVIEI